MTLATGPRIDATDTFGQAGTAPATTARRWRRAALAAMLLVPAGALTLPEPAAAQIIIGGGRAVEVDLSVLDELDGAPPRPSAPGAPATRAPTRIDGRADWQPPRPPAKPSAPVQTAAAPSAPSPAAPVPATPAPAVTPPVAEEPLQLNTAQVRPAAPAPAPAAPPPAAEPAPQPAPPPAAEAPPAPAPAPAAAAPPATEVAALPPADPTIDSLPEGDGFRIVFAPTESDLNETSGSLLSGLAQRMLEDESLRLQIRSYAGGSAETASQARRLSLNRALMVRTFLIDRGVRGTRIDVRALGNTAPDGPADRIDLLFAN